MFFSEGLSVTVRGRGAISREEPRQLSGSEEACAEQGGLGGTAPGGIGETIGAFVVHPVCQLGSRTDNGSNGRALGHKAALDGVAGRGGMVAYNRFGLR